MKKILSLYLLICGLVVNILIMVVFYLFNDQLTLQSTKVNHAVSIITDKLNSSSRASLDELDVYSKQHHHDEFYNGIFHPKNWPTVGPRKHYQAFNTDRYIFVDNESSLIHAIKNAQSGDEIIIKDGYYLLDGKRFIISDAKTSSLQPIVIRAENIGGVNIYLDAVEGFLIDQPNWRIEGINFIGQCDHHSRCEHALHIVGYANNTVIRNNTFYDFNAAIKINKLKMKYPDNGIIENNIFGMNAPRDTNHSVTPINLDHGSNWKIRKNIIHDFIKLGGNKVSYGAFMKGGTHGGIMEQNLIICNTNRERYPGSQVGLSFGGGGIDKNQRRGRSDFEVKNSVIRNNIILHCNDVGIYSQRSSNITINNNIIYNTLGVDVRFKNSTANIFNNIINGRIKDRDNAKSIKYNNYVSNESLFSTELPLYEIFEKPNIGVFRIKKPEALINVTQDASVVTELIIDFCNNTVKPGQSYIGAIYNDRGCFHQ
ncbi:hypothetical protein [Photobacterium nomapromontoriensis]|uniref:hypothetical protein n=1 Tax=Photobacterium nomapromontoriensis TaxID=2910237 RepID=UPI003D108F04